MSEQIKLDLGPPFSRQAWIAASHFHDLTTPQVLGQVAEMMERLSNGMVLLDLDSTLYEVAPRTFQIVKEWIQSEASQFPEVAVKFKNLDESQVGYSIRDLFQALGLDILGEKNKKALDSLKRYWSPRFFSNAYLKYDRPYPGAVEFTKKLYQMGAQVIYLTGRDAPGMTIGTESNLLRDGFPWKVERTHLLLKANAQENDLTHKQSAASYIKQYGQLVASFENEPKNLAALYEIFPDAMHVFVDTICSDHEAMPCRGLYRIPGFTD